MTAPVLGADPAVGGRRWELALVLVTCVWGWTFVAIHDAVETLAPSAFVGYRFAGAALVLGLALLPVLGRITVTEVVGGLLAGAVLFAGYALQTVGLSSTTPSNAGFITGMSVVFTPLLLFTFLRVRPAPRQIGSVVLATVGLGLVTLRGLEPYRGDVLVLGCALAFAVHIAVLSVLSPRAHAGRLTLVQLATVGMLGLAWAGGTGEVTVPATTQVWVALGVTALVASAFAYWVQTRAQATVPPNRIAVIFALEPVFGGLFGYWLAGDRLTPLNLVGAAVILAAMLLTEVRRTPAEP